jgi:hypothetical protein
VTTFRLNAGKATPYRGGSLPRVDSVSACPDELKRMRYWAPNMEPDTPLACGCLIPWPIIQAFGQHIHGQIWCSEHGWQPKITKEQLKDSRRKVKKCTQASTNQTMMEDPPPF